MDQLSPDERVAVRQALQVDGVAGMAAVGDQLVAFEDKTLEAIAERFGIPSLIYERTAFRTKAALALLEADPAMLPAQAAAAIGLDPAAVYRAIARRKGKEICPCCSQIVRAGFTIDSKEEQA
jgi:2-hydroxychromene-2-carboxylate isomerase